MRALTILITAALVCVLCMFAVLPQGCAGNRAREHVGIPALVLASEGVQADATTGVYQEFPEGTDRARESARVAGFFDTLRAKDRAAITTAYQTDWPSVRSYANTGISFRQSSGVIAPGVADSQRERLKQFGETLQRVASGS